ncbi:transposase [Streptomyces alkaliterrae]|uniref:transposase n=1 Tax=Streptomyces alkaliterrae TaxID=2213162 RepID=UPI001E391C17|nr:transposase [Streptomyces alkaliterrae]
MPKPYPEEFRQDVVRVARNRGPGVTVEQVATDFGVHPTSPTVIRRVERLRRSDHRRDGLFFQDASFLPESHPQPHLL